MAAGILSIAVGIPAMVSGGWLSDRVGGMLPGGRMAFLLWMGSRARATGRKLTDN